MAEFDGKKIKKKKKQTTCFVLGSFEDRVHCSRLELHDIELDGGSGSDFN